VRSWTGWYRHIILSMLVHSYLTVVRRLPSGRSPHPICRAAVLTSGVERPPSVEAVEHWSLWRRRHQQRARECH
jgi:hypothetical protein